MTRHAWRPQPKVVSSHTTFSWCISLCKNIKEIDPLLPEILITKESCNLITRFAQENRDLQCLSFWVTSSKKNQKKKQNFTKTKKTLFWGSFCILGQIRILLENPLLSHFSVYRFPLQKFRKN